LNLFDAAPYADNKSQMLNNEDSRQLFEYDEDMGIGYVVSQYEPNFKWFLIVENDMSIVSTQLQSQFCMGIVMIAIVIALVLFIITIVIRRYHKKIIELTVSQELEYQQLLHETTHGLYDSIYEVDITRNRAGGDGTRQYFESLGLSGDTPYDSALKLIADTQVKVEYIKGYLDTFLPENVLASYNSGITNLNYDLMIATDGVHYHWMRIIGRIFFWDTDKSVRMITYRENIDEEKQQEFLLLESSQRDSMTALYNKRTTEEFIENVLKEDLNTGARRAFLMFDIDNFKSVNDSMGHNFGDHVICEIAAEIKSQFRESDIVGRIGGDEFVVLVMEFDSSGELQGKLDRLCARISAKDVGIGQEYHISCSIGIAFSPKHGMVYSELYEHADQALYYAKAHGKNSYSVYGDNIDDNSSYVGQRDIEVLINAATDGIAKYAYMPDIKLLYFNKRYAELTGMPSQILSATDYHPLERVHPEDVSKLLAAINTAKEQKSMFTVTFRMQHHDGYYFHVTQRGIFIGELYKNKYPIYYATYIKRMPQDDESRE
ncbi:MAG: diguanylate cyclase, partial [Christensenella sp.]